MGITACDVRQEFTIQLKSTGFNPVDFWPKQTLNWAVSQYDHVFLFNNNSAHLPDLSLPYGPFPNRLACGVYRQVDFPDGQDPFDVLASYHQQHPDFLVGYLGYDLKNRIENLISRHPTRLDFPEIYFFQPLHIIDYTESALTIRSWEDAGEVARQLLSYATFPPDHTPEENRISDRIKNRVSPDEYSRTVQKIRQDIIDGTVYELNYCIEFGAEDVTLDPVSVYDSLNAQSPMPFSHFQRTNNQYVMGASPERFLKKEGNRLVSQPIKGTIRRGTTPDEDEQLRQRLRTSEKEQAENLMIVDLVRNDLARSAKTGSVRVDELFGIYPFRQLFQMISTVSATLRKEVSIADALRNAFPMGSMTGAPKVRAMELIDQYEASRRSLYSGAAGFITPDGDFDFNVMIRSIFYNSENRVVSFSVGSAITYDADPEQEYEECLLKATAILSVL